MTLDSTLLHARNSSDSSESTSQANSIQDVHELTLLLQLVDALPTEFQPDFYRILDRLAANLESRHRTLGYIQESLNQMSLDLKYLVFDLEATRRERDAYRRMLDPPSSFF